MIKNNKVIRSDKKEPNVDYSRLDGFTPTSGLFTINRKNRQKEVERLNFKQSMTIHDQYHIEIVAHSRLDEVALKVLLSVIGLCSTQKNNNITKRRDMLTNSDEDINFRKMQVDETLHKNEMLKWEGYLADILREAGMSDTKVNYNRLIKRLEQLSHIHYTFSSNKIAASGSTLLSYIIRKDDGKIAVLLSPITTAFVIGKDKLIYTKVSLKEVRQLKSSIATILHSQFSGRVFEGNKMPSQFNLDTVIGWIFNEDDKTNNKETLKKRRKSVRNALDELNQLEGWSVNYKQEDKKVYVKRGRIERIIDAA